MTVTIEVEDESWRELLGLEDLALRAAAAALAGAGKALGEGEVALLFTSDSAVAELNAEWRGKAGATNVLSFPSAPDMPVPAGERRPLGDIVLAHGVIAREAREQGKTLHAHTSHLIVHGVLHLLGYDHEDEQEALDMERLETGILKGLGIPDPYERD
ncbi:rRNA maturation RNase YbeY [Aestuariivirga sp.]|uniref:rRNA maturation RNase YbeY n=1 Tax=Aestuariivirga sp. TaxID=2650926 RepID=UPI003919C238